MLRYFYPYPDTDENATSFILDSTSIKNQKDWLRGE